MANLDPGRPSENAQICAVTQAEAAERAGVGRRTVQHATKVLVDGAEELVAAVEQAGVSVSDAAAVAKESLTTQRALVGAVQRGEAKNLKTAKVRRDIERQRLEIVEGRAVLPEGLFEVIVIDPPWPYDNTYDAAHPTGRSACKYPSMSIEGLQALNLPAAENCMLWLWTTNAFMGEACGLIDAWGFQRKTILTWVKPRLGIGHWLRNQTEHCLLAVRGSPKRSLTNQSTVLEAPAREHSRKPDEFYELVDGLCVGRKLDYFSRECRSGWEQFGNDPAKFGGAP
jgi:N6-adenosine-specific RNA methylase IME4